MLKRTAETLQHTLVARCFGSPAPKLTIEEASVVLKDFAVRFHTTLRLSRQGEHHLYSQLVHTAGWRRTCEPG